MDATIGPELSRRKMLGMAGVAAVAVAIPGVRRFSLPTWAAGEAPAPPPPPPPSDLSLARFTPHVGTRFEVPVGAARVPVTLEEVSGARSHPTEPTGLSGEAFSLIFRGDNRLAFGDGNYQLRHPVLGTVPLFLVAVGTGRNGQGYQAVVDRRALTR